jgi:hypothetical protein
VSDVSPFPGAFTGAKNLATRIFDFRPSDENALVEKILVLVHKSVDQHLPAADTAPKRYSKTLFSEEESTALVRAAIDHEKDLEAKGTQKMPPPPPMIPRHDGLPGQNAHGVTAPPKGPPSNMSAAISSNQDDPDQRTPAESLPLPKDAKSSRKPEHLNSLSDPKQFSTTFEYTEPKVPGGEKDLFMVILGLLVLAALAVGYWYLFESERP